MRRTAALLAAAALAGPIVESGAATRHEAGAGDPHGPVQAQAWVEPAEESQQSGHDVHVRPPLSPDAPGLGVQPPQGAPGIRVPSVEGPSTARAPHLPDLVPLKAWDLFIDEAPTPLSGALPGPLGGTDPSQVPGLALYFGVKVANRGPHSLELLAVPTGAGNAERPGRFEARQCVRFAGPRVGGSGRVCQEHVPVGGFAWDRGELRLEGAGFLQYRLMRDRGGQPDRGPGGSIATGRQDGVCVSDTEWFGTPPAVNLDDGWYHECRNATTAVRQGISPGWGTYWEAGLPGQFLPLGRASDGLYWLEVAVNRGGPKASPAVRETRVDNNVSLTRLRISHARTRAEPM